MTDLLLNEVHVVTDDGYYVLIPSYFLKSPAAPLMVEQHMWQKLSPTFTLIFKYMKMNDSD